ncbi:MAG: PilZ domain-containing protein [Candidatus Omnitrophota bacterium]
MINRRKFLRFNAELRIEYEIPSSGAKGSALALNISRTGMRLLADKKLESGSGIFFRIELPDDDSPIFINAKVVWGKPIDIREFGFSFVGGLSIERIDNYDRVRLLDYSYSRWIQARGKTMCQEQQ